MLIHRDSKAWQLQVWVSFLLAAFLCGVGLAWLPGRDLDRAFMVMGYFFCLSAAFVLAKFVRDNEKSKAQGRNADVPLCGLERLLPGDGTDGLGTRAHGDQRDL